MDKLQKTRQTTGGGIHASTDIHQRKGRDLIGRALKAVSLAVSVGTAALLGSAQVAHANELALFTEFNTDWVSEGAGGLRNVGSSSALALAGIGGPVTLAYLYWSGPTDSIDPAANANVMLAGTPVTGTNIGFSNDNCWGYGNSQAYRADVTSIVQGVGNGAYPLAGFGSGAGGINSNGASLIVFFKDADNTNNRDVVIFDGNDSNMPNTYDNDGWNISLPGINYSTGPVTMELHVADGQEWLDAPLVLDALILDPGPQIFPGTTVPSDNNGPTGNGSLWDIVGYDVTSWLSLGPNTLTMTTGQLSDCLSAHVVLFDLPAGAAPEQPANINIKPNSDPNSINSCSSGTTPVTIWGSDALDVTRINPDQLVLATATVKTVGKSDKILCSTEDVGAYDEAFFDNIDPIPDGYDDLTCHFITMDLGATDSSTEADLIIEACDGGSGSGSDGQCVLGDPGYSSRTATDAVNIVRDC